MDILRKLASIGDLPTIPTTATRVVELVNREDAGPHDLAKIVMSDQALSAKLLRVANSPIYGLQWPVSDVEKAIFMLGFGEVRDLALSVSVFDSLYLPMGRGGLFDRARFWEHSFVVAVLTRELAQAQKLTGGNAFTAGLLHDVGKVALDRYFPELFRQIAGQVEAEGVSFAVAEQAVLQTTHAEIGAFLLRHWRLPDDLVVAAERHHTPAQSPQPMAALVYLANALAHAAGFASMDAEPQLTLQDILNADETKAMCAAGSPPPAAALQALAARLNDEGENISAQAAMLV